MSVYIPAQQDEEDRPPRAGGEQVGDGLLSNQPPCELNETREKECKEHQGECLG